MQALIAEELVLLLLDRRTGRLRHAAHLEAGAGGALLVELALAGAVELQGRTGFWSRPSVVTTPRATGVSDPELVRALTIVAERPRSAQDLVVRLGRGRREVLLWRLAQRGVVRQETGRLLGVFTRRRWVVVDPRVEADLRLRLGDVLVHGVFADQRACALLVLLSSVHLAHVVLDRGGLSASEVRRRTAWLGRDDWVAAAVRKVLSDAQVAATTAATAAATAAATSAASSST